MKQMINYSKGSTDRNNKLDTLRGIAIGLVIVGHGIDLLLQKNIFSLKVGSRIYDIIYMFHMPLFFMISGYITKSQKQRVMNIILKNIITFYIPYLFLNYLYWIERLVASQLLGMQLTKEVEKSLKEVISLCWTGKGETWFLLSLLFVKILFSILDTYTSDRITFFCFSILYWLSYIFPQNRIGGYLSWGIFFVLGHIIYKYSIDKRQKDLMIIVCMNVMLIGILRYRECGLDTLVKLLIGSAVFMAYMLYAQYVPDMNLIMICGKQSIVIYMVHGLTQYFSFYFVTHIMNIQFAVLILTLMVVIQLLLCFMVIKLLTRFKWIQFIFYPFKCIKKAR